MILYDGGIYGDVEEAMTSQGRESSPDLDMGTLEISRSRISRLRFERSARVS